MEPIDLAAVALLSLFYFYLFTLNYPLVLLTGSVLWLLVAESEG